MNRLLIFSPPRNMHHSYGMLKSIIFKTLYFLFSFANVNIYNVICLFCESPSNREQISHICTLNRSSRTHFILWYWTPVIICCRVNMDSHMYLPQKSTLPGYKWFLLLQCHVLILDLVVSINFFQSQPFFLLLTDISKAVKLALLQIHVLFYWPTIWLGVSHLVPLSQSVHIWIV